MTDLIDSTGWGFATLAAHAGEEGSPDEGKDGAENGTGGWRPTSTPIYNATGFAMPTLGALDEVFAGSRQGYFYTRDGNPTVRAFEAAVAALESTAASHVTAFASGMAAIHAALLASGLRAGDTILATRDCYGGTRGLLNGHFADLGVRTVWLDMTDHAAVERALAEPAAAEHSKVVYLETISNPLVIVLDLPRLAELARRAGVLTIVDNTFPSPYLLRPLECGADLVVHSATKYIGGHGDATGGTVAAREGGVAERLRSIAKVLGAVLGPNEAWLCHRGLKTLPLRMARQCDNALEIARRLDAHSAISRVYYPGLPSHPQHDLAGPLLGGRYGAMLSFDLADATREAAGRFTDALRLVVPAPTLGDLRTLVQYPLVASHRSLTPEERRAVRIGNGLLRLSIGIEDPADLIADLDRALRAVG
jgi:cystathionine beta-lyase/cystathionine gamma-synthase